MVSAQTAVTLFAPALAAAAEAPPRVWEPFGDRRLRLGVLGVGPFALAFPQHPNVEVVAVADFSPARRAELLAAAPGATEYESFDELNADDRLEAIYIASDAPSHAAQTIAALERGRHVACAVPAVFGNLEDADRVYDAVRRSGRRYMLFETSIYHEDLHAARTLAQAGALGEVLYTEGEYYHYMPEPIPSYGDWRVGLPPQFYPTHSNAYYVGIAGGWFTHVACVGRPSVIAHLQAANNRWGNPFGTEIALLRCDNGGSARMAVSWDTPGGEGEKGRVRTTLGNFDGTWHGPLPDGLDLRRPALPPGLGAGDHGGSHGHLIEEFVRAVLTERDPLVNVAWGLNMTVAGIVAHQSALRDGEWLPVPVYRWPA